MEGLVEVLGVNFRVEMSARDEFLRQEGIVNPDALQIVHTVDGLRIKLHLF